MPHPGSSRFALTMPSKGFELWYTQIMKILLMSIGSRGDIEPFLAIAELLKEKGHEVVGVFPEQFKNLAEEVGIGFRSLGPEFLALLDTEAGKLAMGGDGSGLKKLFSYIALARQSMPIQKKLILRQRKIVTEESPDLIIHNSKAVYTILWSIKHPNQTVHVSPIPYLVHTVVNLPHIGLGNKSLGSFINALTYRLGNFGIIQTAKRAAKWLQLPEKVSGPHIKHALLNETMIYCISPSLFPRPHYWPSRVHVVGYQERNKTLSWQADDELEHFLKKHNKILLLTFGSMTNQHPVEKTKLFLEILEKHNIPTIINTSVGGLVRPEVYNKELFHFVTQIPYDWIFPKVYGVIHHGGSGTTHMALRYGCANMVVPHIIDQFLWNNVVTNLGAGPKGSSIGKLEQGKLENNIVGLWQNQLYKENAQQIAEIMQKEDSTDELFGLLTKPR